MNLTTLYRLIPRKRMLTDFYVFDTETGVRKKDGNILWGGVMEKDGTVHREIRATPDQFIFGVIYGHNFCKVIHNVEEFRQELLDPRYKNKKIFAHNAGAFDLLVLYGGSVQSIFNMDPNAVFIGPRFIMATNGNCIFADSLNIFQTSLKVIGKLLGNKKGRLPIESPVDSKVINYCIQDCHILWDALYSTFEFAGDIKITQASLSMTYFRRHHLSMNIEHNENTKYFWSSYFGGRTEVFKLGKTHASVIDCNSMYPAHMRNKHGTSKSEFSTFPNPKFLKHETNPPVKIFIKNILPHNEGMFSGTVTHKKSTYGYLPFKSDKGKLLFPIGRFKGAWNFPEIRYALESGAVTIDSIDYVVYAEPMQSPFIGFVDTLYEERFKPGKLEFEIYRIKIFMNSLYGKFAQRITQETIYIEDIQKQFHIIREYQDKGLFLKIQMFSADRMDAYLIIKSKKQFKVSFSIPSFASYITSYARVSLLKKLYAMEKNKPVYCDTDSIFYEIDDAQLQSEKFLGGWKKEDKIVTEIKGLKNYKYLKTLKHTKLVKEVHMVKGIPGKAKKIGPDSWEYFSLTRAKDSIRKNKVPGMLVKRTKTVTGIYDKREILINGETKPIEI